MANASIQFFRGIDEPVVPDIRLTRSRDGAPDRQRSSSNNPRPWLPKPWGTSEACGWSTKKERW